MKSIIQKALLYAENNDDYFLSDVCTFLRIPSISTTENHKRDIQNAAQWLANKFNQIGMQVIKIIQSESNPIVYAEWLDPDNNKPTILFYGHYDLVPPEPLEEWRSDPFEPLVKDGNIYGRGTNDDKCQLYSFVGACETYLKTSGQLPVNIKFLLEGAEEEGSNGMESVLEKYKELFRCDVAVVVDGAFMDSKTPIIGTGSRGIVSTEVLLNGPARDLHSGNYGGIIHNPLQAAAELIATLHDENCRVTIPGFYDKVLSFSQAEKQEMQRLTPSHESYRENLGVPSLWGEPGYSVLERLGTRPTLEIHGIGGGFSGNGHKTIIPAQAIIKISMRIVPNQEPLEIFDIFKKHILMIAPPTNNVTVKLLSYCHPSNVDIHSPFLRLAKVCYKEGFGLDPIMIRNGGSLAILGLFQKILRVPVLPLGLGLPDDGLHSPNEKFSLSHFFNGIKGMIYMIDEAAKMKVNH
jgi:acetylornithine deacetylase/succinyl-diaminopimelate desuccinylase-like protein